MTKFSMIPLSVFWELVELSLKYTEILEGYK